MNDSRNVPLMGDLNTVVCMNKVNSCISESCNFIIFLYFIHLWQKLNSLQRYDIAQNYSILHWVVQHLSQHNLKISHHPHIQKQNNDSNKTYRYVHDLLPPKFICLSATVHELSSQNKL
jgi:hypothetical protein